MKNNDSWRLVMLCIILGMTFISACVSVDVSSASLIQKRKYRKGHYVKNREQLNHLIAQECKNDRDPLTGENDSQRAIDSLDQPQASASRNGEIAINTQQKHPLIQMHRSVNPTDKAQFPKEKINRKRNASDNSVAVEKHENSTDNDQPMGLAAVFGFIFSLFGLLIPALAPAGIAICAADLKGVGKGYAIAGLILGIIEFIGWTLLSVVLILAGFPVWGWIIAALLFIGIIFAILLISGAFW